MKPEANLMERLGQLEEGQEEALKLIEEQAKEIRRLQRKAKAHHRAIMLIKDALISHKNNMVGLRAIFKQTKKRLDNFRPHETEMFLNEAKTDAQHVHKVMRNTAIKEAVFTEVRFMLRDSRDELAIAMVGAAVCFDYSMKWWVALQNCTLECWADTFIIIGAESLRGNTIAEADLKDYKAQFIFSKDVA